MINLSCPNCGVRMRAPDDKLGHWGKCTNCQKKFVVGKTSARKRTSGPTPTNVVPQDKSQKKLVKIGGLILLLVAILLFASKAPTPVAPPSNDPSAATPPASNPIAAIPETSPAPIVASPETMVAQAAELGANGGAENLSKAFRLYEQAALAGNAEAMNKTGNCYFHGTGVTIDLNKAFRWYERGADAGSPKALNNLAFCYLNGKGVTRDAIKAVKFFERGTNAGIATSMGNLGWCYENGQGVAQDYRKAAELYDKAARAGEARFQTNLGTLYQKEAAQLWMLANTNKYYFNYAPFLPLSAADHMDLLTRIGNSSDARRSKLAELIMIYEYVNKKYEELGKVGEGIKGDLPGNWNTGRFKSFIHGLVDESYPSMKSLVEDYSGLLGSIDKGRKNEIAQTMAKIFLYLISGEIANQMEGQYRDVLGGRRFPDAAGLFVDGHTDEVSGPWGGGLFPSPLRVQFARLSYKGDQPLTNVVVITRTLPKPRSQRTNDAHLMANLFNNAFSYSDESTRDAAILLELYNVSRETPTAGAIYIEKIEKGDILHYGMFEFGLSRHIQEANVTVYCDRGIIFNKTIMKSDPETDDGFGAHADPIPDPAWKSFGPPFKALGRSGHSNLIQAFVRLHPQKDGSRNYTFEGCIPIGETFSGTGQQYAFPFDEQNWLETVAEGQDFYVALGPPRSAGQALILVPRAIVAMTKVVNNGPREMQDDRQEDSSFGNMLKKYIPPRPPLKGYPGRNRRKPRTTHQPNR